MQQQFDVAMYDLEEDARTHYLAIQHFVWCPKVFRQRRSKTRIKVAIRPPTECSLSCLARSDLWATRGARESRSILRTPEESRRIGSDAQRCTEKRAMILRALIINTVIHCCTCWKVLDFSYFASLTCTTCSTDNMPIALAFRNRPTSGWFF